MPRFQHGSVELDFLDEGEGEPVLLIHGFASTKEVNWVEPSWTATLRRAGRRVIAFDHRGHGRSTKLYDPAAYHSERMAEDAAFLLDTLGIERADVLGYSLGARVGAYLALRRPERVRSLVLGGLGLHLVDGVGLPDSIADALEAPSLDAVTDPTGRTFRSFAERTRSDLRALAACIRGSRQSLTRAEVGALAVPTLVAVGTRDDVAGSAAELAALLPDAEVLDIPGRDHMLAVGDRAFKAGVISFFERRA